jgi:hypothetical protein
MLDRIDACTRLGGTRFLYLDRCFKGRVSVGSGRISTTLKAWPEVQDPDVACSLYTRINKADSTAATVCSVMHCMGV